MTHNDDTGSAPVEPWTFDPACDPTGFWHEIALTEAVSDGRVAASSVPGWRDYLRDNAEVGEQVLAVMSTAAPPDTRRR